MKPLVAVRALVGAAVLVTTNDTFEVRLIISGIDEASAQSPFVKAGN